MTHAQFLAILARTPRDWEVVDGRIRRGSGEGSECPVTAVARRMGIGPWPFPSCAVLPAASGLQLEPWQVSALVQATDYPERADPLLRLELLEACGLLVEEGRHEPAGQG